MDLSECKTPVGLYSFNTTEWNCNQSKLIKYAELVKKNSEEFYKLG